MPYKPEAGDFVQIAHCEDISLLSELMEMSGNEALKLREDMRELLGVWLASLDPDALEWMGEKLVELYKKDIPRDTALLSLRDFVNARAVPVKAGITVNSGYPEQIILPAEKGPISLLWLGIIETITTPNAYRICSHCGKPFTYKSPRAVYCSDVCRTYAHRESKEAVAKATEKVDRLSRELQLQLQQDRELREQQERELRELRKQQAIKKKLVKRKAKR